MPKRSRLTRSDFTDLRRAPLRRMSGAYFSLSCTSLPDGESAKAACVVSKKVAARAVARNRIKRICREAVRAHLSSVKPPQAFVFTAKRAAAAASPADIRGDVERLLAAAL
ncbi:MAG: ribonuclease P protein component [Patescibacteria group bacterium]|nr:ribonuclease P protein component [bacterium]MDZ4227288.1 ribonuclease P protein component [Patescibacteria group bacterium]